LHGFCFFYLYNPWQNAKPTGKANMPSNGIVFDIKKFSIHDGPGIRTTLFLKGCPLSCIWCHNPESQSPKAEIHYFENRCILCGDCAETCENGAIQFTEGIRLWDADVCQFCGDCVEICPTEAIQLVGEEKSIDEIMQEIEKDVIYFDQSGGGVTFSGGEPLNQIDFLLALLQKSKEHKIHTAVDTSGFASWASFQKILPYTDLFLYDLKLMDDDAHKKYTGVSNQVILRNLSQLAGTQAKIQVRIPLIPQINDGEENLKATIAFLRRHQIQDVALLPYHHIASDKYHRMGQNYELEKLKTPSAERMEEIASFFEGFHLKIGG
jgi:pyruvate formate lyase activating enzyme